MKRQKRSNDRVRMMVRRLAKASIITLFLAFAVPAEAGIPGESRLEAILRSVSRPRLIYPNDRIVDLTGKRTIKFRWALYNMILVKRDYIEFRLYRGKKIDEANILMTERLPFNAYTLEVNSDLFKDGESYTWVITQFYLRGEDTSDNSAIFEVIKNQ